jgi:photosystem II stability/assembly factor-like uncharacterized protein
MKLMTILFLLAAAIAPAQSWQQFGPRGLSVAALARVPGIASQVYAVTDGFPALVLYSSDGGTNWNIRDTIFDRIADLVVDPDQVLTLYAGGLTGRIWGSTAGGQFWTERGALAGVSYLRRLALTPGQSLVLRAAVELPGPDGTVALGFRVSTDGGANWTGTLVDTGRTAAATALECDPGNPNRLFLGGSIAGAARLFASADGGGSWNDITGELGGTAAWGAAVNPLDPAVILAATGNGIWRSTNSGGSWTRMKDVPAWSVAFAAASPHYAYAGSDNLVCRSNNLGINWSADTTTFAGTATRWLAINPLDGLDLYVGNGRGIFRTTSGGLNWTELTGNLLRLTIPFVYFHPASPETIFTCPPGHGLLVSGNRGASWQGLAGFPGAGFTTGIALNPAALDTLYAIRAGDHRVYMTSDRGDSWTRQPVETGFAGHGIAFHPLGPDTLYAWGGLNGSDGRERFGFWKSIDRGYNWSRVFSPGTRGRCLGFRFAAGGDSLFLWGGVDGRARVYLSLNRGGTWLERSTDLAGTLATDFVTAPGTNRTSYLCATDAGVFRTLNAGTGWTGLGLENVTAVLADTIIPDFILAATDTQGIYRTTNSGAFWERDTVELPHRSLTLFRRHPADPAAVYCGTIGSSFYGLGVIGISEPAPGPRPRPLDVRPTVIRAGATIRLGALAGRRAVVELYTPDGRRAGPATELDPAPATWSWPRPRGLPAGVYLLRIRSSGADRFARVVLAD